MANKKTEDPVLNQAEAAQEPEKNIQEMLEKAREEVAAMLEEARAKAAEIVKAAEPMKPAVPPVPAEPEKMVRIKLFKDNAKYRDDVFVGVNGKGWLIKRGVSVEVPESVAEVLENSLKQDEATAMLIERESSKYENDPMTK